MLVNAYLRGNLAELGAGGNAEFLEPDYCISDGLGATWRQRNGRLRRWARYCVAQVSEPGRMRGCGVVACGYGDYAYTRSSADAPAHAAGTRVVRTASASPQRTAADVCNDNNRMERISEMMQRSDARAVDLVASGPWGPPVHWAGSESNPWQPNYR